MDRFWWMCLLCFRLYELIWRVLDILLHLHLFYDKSWLPFGNSSQKGGVHMHVDRESFCFGAKFYLGASLMYFFLFGSWCIYFLWVVYVRGRHYVLCFFYCFLFHMWYIGYCFILWDYSWYMSSIFCFVKSRIFFWFTCILHTWVYILGSRASKGKIVTTEQVQLGIGVRVQM